ncbi:hypothetical protein WJX74_008604 [Apatococcus lobatus]|uniref:Acyltransferase n=1 Tax=Apatococcus lobatus TaxID=904363 RepID=A0AAW1SGF1_9CHLO
MYVIAIFYNVLGTALALFFWSHPLSWTFLALQVALAVWPLEPVPDFGRKLIQFSSESGAAYFPVTMHADSPESFTSHSKPYIIGYEPHSTLPIAMPIAFNDSSLVLPKGLTHVRQLASSICFYIPLVRQLWWWLGVRPVSKENIKRLLSQGHSVVLCPGGVREIFYMEKGREVAFLSKRQGFVKLAIQQGVDIIPCFAFGQTASYDWWKPGPPIVPLKFVHWVSRSLGYIPLLIWGVMGSPIPKQVPMRLFLGAPIPVTQSNTPLQSEIDETLQKFIEAMKSLYNQHKVEAGYAESVQLHVY